MLPFHKMGEHKWEEMGMTYRLTDTPSPTAEQIERAGAIFREHGIANVFAGNSPTGAVSPESR